MSYTSYTRQLPQDTDDVRAAEMERTLLPTWTIIGMDYSAADAQATYAMYAAFQQDLEREFFFLDHAQYVYDEILIHESKTKA